LAARGRGAEEEDDDEAEAEAEAWPLSVCRGAILESIIADKTGRARTVDRVETRATAKKRRKE